MDGADDQPEPRRRALVRPVVYTAKNLGITSVIFRAQRTWGAGD